MTKTALIFLLALFLASLACGSTTPSPGGTQLSTSEPAPVSQVPRAPAQDLPPAESHATEPETGMEEAVSTPPGLRVVYIREGDLWSWTEAGGKAQLTDSGDMSTARLSNDGQWLAFMRGREVWTVRMDGSDARLLVTQAEVGGALWFAPNGLLLAVSTGTNIAVIDPNTSTSNTVTTYPALPSGFFPEVVWSPDAFGFKTVIPPQTEAGQAELLFVFTDGTIASLAKFEMVPLSESLPHLSPDGGYVVYVAKMGASQESLHVMDSSGAARPYGEPADSVRALGWLLDSKRFVYAAGNPSRTMVGDVLGNPPVEIAVSDFDTMRWVDEEHFLAMGDGSLYLGDIKGGKTLIDVGVTDFDW